MPTVLTWLDLPVPAGMQGRDALAALPPDRPMLLERRKPSRTLLGLRRGPWKLLLADPPGPRTPAEALFRLRDDCQERSDLCERRPGVLSGLEALIRRLSGA